MSLTPDQLFISKQLGTVPTANDDIELLFEEEGGDAPFSKWLEDQRATRPHWFTIVADSALEVLYSLKAQADHVREHGEAQTRAVLNANSLTLGKIKPRPKQDASTLAPATNPYHPNFKGDRQAKIASMIAGLGAKATAQIAAAAGKRIDGSPLGKR